MAPAPIAVLGVAAHERPSWVVAHEGRGLNLALERLVQKAPELAARERRQRELAERRVQAREAELERLRRSREP